MTDVSTADALIHWHEGGLSHQARWRSESGIRPHKKVVVVDDTLTADAAYRMACEGTAMLWRGDFQNARQLLQALVRRVDRPSKKSQRNNKNQSEISDSRDRFNLHRLAQSQRARILGMLLLECDSDHSIHLRRAPDVRQACMEVYGKATESYVVSLRELMGLISAHEWRKKGVPILLGGKELIDIHPHYGVFSPIRGEYIELVFKTQLPEAMKLSSSAIDIGVGTGVLSIVLAKRGIQKIVATDLDDRAIACAQENINRLNLASQIEIRKADLYPEDRVALVVCNPPWLPARPSSSLERAVYDPDNVMLKSFLAGLKNHLLPNGEGWLILSDLAEHLGLRSRDELLQWIKEADLRVLGREDVRPQHKKALDKNDALHVARSREITSLWRLAV